MSMINKLIGDDYLRDEYWEEIGEYINIGTFTGKGKGLSELYTKQNLECYKRGIEALHKDNCSLEEKKRFVNYKKLRDLLVQQISIQTQAIEARIQGGEVEAFTRFLNFKEGLKRKDLNEIYRIWRKL